MRTFPSSNCLVADKSSSMCVSLQMQTPKRLCADWAGLALIYVDTMHGRAGADRGKGEAVHCVNGHLCLQEGSAHQAAGGQVPAGWSPALKSHLDINCELHSIRPPIGSRWHMLPMLFTGPTAIILLPRNNSP